MFKYLNGTVHVSHLFCKESLRKFSQRQHLPAFMVIAILKKNLLFHYTALLAWWLRIFTVCGFWHLLSIMKQALWTIALKALISTIYWKRENMKLWCFKTYYYKHIVIICFKKNTYLLSSSVADCGKEMGTRYVKHVSSVLSYIFSVNTFNLFK